MTSKGFGWRAAALAAAIALAACHGGAAPPSAPDAGKDLAALKAVNDAVNAANKGKDAQASVAQDGDDMVSFFPGAPPVQGKAADLVAAKAGFADPAYAYVQTLERTEVARSGDLAYQSGHYDMTITDAATHKPRRLTGHWLAALRKDPSGAWKYAAFAGTPSPTPP